MNWIRVEDQPPPYRQLVLVYQDDTGLCLRSQQGNDDWYDENSNWDDSELEITHWQPLPDPPPEKPE